jgi:hypothetical protein
MDTNALSGYSGESGTPFSFSTSYLLVSLLWGSIGVGFSIYGKKQRFAPAWIGGIALIGITYFIRDVIWMSVAAVAILAGIWFWSRYD